MIHRTEKICPRCDAPTLKAWGDLRDEEQDMIKRLGRLKDKKEAKQSQFCTRCWHIVEDGAELA